MDPNNPAAPTPITPSATPVVPVDSQSATTVSDPNIAPAANPAQSSPVAFDQPATSPSASIPDIPIDPAPPVAESVAAPSLDVPAMGSVQSPITAAPEVAPDAPVIDQSTLQPPANPAPASSSVDLSSISAPAVDNAPTDLSHLAAALGVPAGQSLGSQSSGSAPAATSPAASAPATPEVASTTVATPSASPKKLIIVAAILILVVVAGASAYFILGIGQTPTETTSVPAQTQLTAPPKAVVTPAQEPVVDSSAASASTFGAVQGATESAQVASPSATPSAGGSVFDRRR